MRHFRSVLVANRGEIALRVLRSATSLGYRTIAVFSEADAGAPHVCAADDACLLGPAAPAESYLNIARLLAAATATGAEAIHPGYGFLSENAVFARAVEAAGLVFIGPTPKAIELMGNKATARQLMRAAGVPCVPGYDGREQSDAVLAAEGARIGYPLMVKAAAGGGGRGMRLVERAEALQDALRSARSEAMNAFGSDQLILERAILRPRHVEIQVFADAHGHVIHLGERDCSVQRRHQKVVEEAPCPALTPELRARMGATAVAAARSIGYRGAGTIEFLLDEGGEFHFLEMNTRLQVEHPVTELVTGLDLVALQFRVADGEALGIAQEDVRLSGHAIEARLYAEDPAREFLPASGRVLAWEPPCGEGIRVDAGIVAGQEISPFYDPLLAKVIAWGETRDAAIARLVAALERTRLFGVASNRGFLADVLERERFRQGLATTAFIAEEFPAAIEAEVPTAEDAAVFATLQYLCDREVAQARALARRPELLDWSSSGTTRFHCRYREPRGSIDVLLSPHRGGAAYTATVAGRRIEIQLLEHGPSGSTFNVDGRRADVDYCFAPAGMLHVASGRRTLSLRNERACLNPADEQDSGGRVTAVMHGALLEVLVRAGDRVTKGTRLAVLEAMKMQHEVCSTVEGEVMLVAVESGTQVAAGDLLIEIRVDVPG